MINRDRLVKTFCDLVSIDSPSGEEETIAIELVRRLRTMGLEVMRDAYGNVIATAPGDQPVMLSAHMDTVEPDSFTVTPCWALKPFILKIWVFLIKSVFIIGIGF